MSFDIFVPKDWVDALRGQSWDSTTFHVFLVVLGTGIVDFIARRFVRRLRTGIAARTENPWDDALLDALPAPLSVLIWAIGLRIATLVIGGPVFTDPRVTSTFTVIFILTAVWFFVRWISRIEYALIEIHKDKEEEERLDATTVHAIGKLLRLAVVITGILICLQTWHIDVSAVLAFGGIGGLAIGFAARDLLANFFGAITIYLDKPFRVGDWIRSPDRNIEGTVEYIGWRQTRIRTFDKRPLYVPNAVFSTIAIENPQRMLRRRIYETIGIRYDDISKMDVITRDVEQMLRTHPEIDTDQLLMVYFNAFAASSCDFFIYTFTKTTDWAKYHAVKHDVLLKIARIIEGHGAEIAFPTSTLHIASIPREQPATVPSRVAANPSKH